MPDCDHQRQHLFLYDAQFSVMRIIMISLLFALAPRHFGGHFGLAGGSMSLYCLFAVALRSAELLHTVGEMIEGKTPRG